MAISLVLGGKKYKSIADAKNELKLKINNFDPKDQFWFDLIKLHPNSIDKIGAGIDSFFVTRNIGGHKQLNIKRIDGSIVDFSFLKCFSRKSKTPKQNLNAAMRTSISNQIKMFKDENFYSGFVCGLCGVIVNDRLNAHVDHIIRFKEISEDFLKDRQVIPLEFDDDPVSNSAAFKREDNGFELDWYLYHARHAKLRLICATCNLRRP